MKVVITAGPTREYIDPVRFLSNPSTGKMGFAIAEAAVKAGYEVVLVAGPVSLPTPRGVRRIDVVSARDMYRAVQREIKDATIFIASAAVADWRPKCCAKHKLKKGGMCNILELTRNPDILKSVKAPVKIGFAAETNDVLAEGRRKCREKHLKFIVVNDVTKRGSGFAVDTNEVSFVYASGEVKAFACMSKRKVATTIISAAAKFIA